MKTKQNNNLLKNKKSKTYNINKSKIISNSNTQKYNAARKTRKTIKRKANFRKRDYLY